jgi:hypothetical protein
MATTATRIVPDRANKGDPGKGQQKRKPMSKSHKAKLVKALKEWRDGLSDEERAELAERNRQTHKDRWASMSKRERDARLAGVRKWQAEQRAAKKAAAKGAPKADPKTAPGKGSTATSVGESAATARRSRKAVAK